MMYKSIIFRIVILISLFSIPELAYSADRVYMPFFELINVHSDYQYSTARLFKNYIDEQGRYTLVIPQKPDSVANALPIEKVRETAKNLNCLFFIMGDLNRIGENVIISVSMYNTENNTLVWSDRLKASNPDDIDPILQKLSRAIGTKNKSVNDDNIYSVTENESRQLRQINVNSAFGISIGTTMMLSSPFNTDPFSGGFGVFWYYDARTMLYEIHGNVYFTGTNGLGYISINANYPFFPESNTPFIGGGIGLGYTSEDNKYTSGTQEFSYDTKGGLMIFAGFGYIIGRISNVGIRAHLNYFLGTYKMSGPDKSLPNGLLLNLELYFGK